MAKHRAHSVELKRQVVQGFLGGETMLGLAKRHDLSRNLIRIWVQKYEAGDPDDDMAAAHMLQGPSQTGEERWSSTVRTSSGSPTSSTWRFGYVSVVLDAWSRRVVATRSAGRSMPD